MTTPVIIIDTDKPCKRCGQGGATQGGYCMACVLKNMKEGKYDHILKSIRKECGVDK